jgi:5'-nucleotidase
MISNDALKNDPPSGESDKLVVAISSRALFDLRESHALFERDGLDAYRRYQIAREDEVLSRGIAFPLAEKLLRLNAMAADTPRVEVILLSRNSGDTGLRIFNSIEHYGLEIVRAAFTSGASTYPYAIAFGANLFLSANAEDVTSALRSGLAAATILPSKAARTRSDQLRIAFDGDAVLFGDESERISHEQGLQAFHDNESARARHPLPGGPFRGFLSALHRIQAAFPAETSPLRTALVTARSAPAHKRVILTLREWGVRIDESLFLGGRDKGPFLQAFGADIFFDDSRVNIESAAQHVAAGHVPHGVRNE